MKFLLLLIAASLIGREQKPAIVDTPCHYCESYTHLHSANPCSENPCNPHRWGGKVDASFAVWQAKEEGLNFAFDNSPRFPQATYGTNPRSNISGQFIGPDFNWMPALKVNLGVEFPQKGWDMDLRWTFFYSHNNQTAHANATTAGFGLLPVWILPSADVSSPTLFGQARGSWQLHLNTIDWELGYDFFLTKALSLRLSGGLKGVSLFQKFHVDYSEGILVNTLQPVSFSTQMSNDALGLGPRIAFFSRWRLPKGFSLMADIAGAFALTVFDMKREDNDALLNSGAVNQVNSQYNESFWAYRPILECRMGLSWDTCYGARKQFPFGFDLFYELQNYWEQNMLRLLVANPVLHLAFPQRGDLMVQGMTLTFRFGY